MQQELAAGSVVKIGGSATNIVPFALGRITGIFVLCYWPRSAPHESSAVVGLSGFSNFGKTPAWRQMYLEQAIRTDLKMLNDRDTIFGDHLVFHI